MPATLIAATGLTPDNPKNTHVWVGGTEITDRGLLLAGLTIQDDVGEPGTTEFELLGGMADHPHVRDQAQVRVYDYTTDTEVTRAYVVSRRPTRAAKDVDRVSVIATGINSLLDDTFVPSAKRPAETMAARIGYFWGRYGGTHLSRDFSFVEDIGDELLPRKFEGVTLRQAIETTVADAHKDADYSLDNLGRLHVFLSESNTAPYSIGPNQLAAFQLDTLASSCRRATN